MLDIFKLTNICEELLQAIVRSIDRIPEGLLDIINQIATLLEQRSPERKRAVIAEIMFLRYFCFGIFSPESFDIVSLPISQTVRRAFMLIAKTMQTLALYRRFVMEEYMTCMNKFIARSEPTLNRYIDQLCVR